MRSNGTATLGRCGEFARRYRFRVAAALVMLAGAWFVLIVVPAARHEHHVEMFQREFLHDVERLGGHVVFARTGAEATFPPVLAVNLDGASVDSELMERLSTFSSIERLNMEGAVLSSDGLRSLNRLTGLETLLLAGSTVSDNDLEWDALQLTTLSLGDTPVSDIGLSRLVKMTSLVNLDIHGTSVTAAGLPSLQKFPSLRTLDLDHTCMTADGFRVLQAIKSLKEVRIHVAEGSGRHVAELAGILANTVSVQGLHPAGYTLWDARQPWDETLAGVAETTARLVDLDSQQVTRLMTVIAQHGMGPRQTSNDLVRIQGRPRPRPSGMAIESVGEFLSRLQDAKPGPPADEIRVFACDRFAKDDMPQLLDALREPTDLHEAASLRYFAAYLLVRDGLENPAAVLALDQMFTHEDPEVRRTTAQAFGYDGHPYCEDWMPSEHAVDFGLPRLLKLCRDPDRVTRLTASDVLGNLVRHYPDRASAVMPVMIEMLAQRDAGWANHAIRQIAEVNPAVARTSIPHLRVLLKQALRAKTDVRFPHLPFVIEAVCDISRCEPALANEAAVECLQLIRNGDSAGRQLVRLMAPANSEAVRTIIHELLDLSASNDPQVAALGQQTLARAATAIRDFQPR